MADASAARRIVSLDLVRGLALAGMLVVNNQGDWSHVYPALRHAAWNGLSGADLVFPFFLFAVGAAIPFAQAARQAAGATRVELSHAILRRTAILAGLGILINVFPHFDWQHVRIPGVLQRIACCYGMAAGLALVTGMRGRALAAAGLLAGYGLLLMLCAPAGQPLPQLPLEGTIVHRLDAWLLAGHTYAHAPAPGFDPEGIISTAGALATTIIGMLAGDYCRTRPPSTHGALRIFAAGALMAAAGLAIDALIPVNKNLWTPSYALLTAGLALALLAGGVGCADAGGHRRGTVLLTALGRNALILYLLSGLAGKAMAFISISPNGKASTGKALVMDAIGAWRMSPATASLCYALAFLIFFTLLAWVLDRRQWYVTL